jgi:tetratricopeptide (TPR) repeat protein
MAGTSEPVGTLDVALAHATRLLQTAPALAAEQAAEILAVVPGHPAATLLSGVAHRRGGHTDAALEILEPLARAHPNWAAVHYELGMALGGAGRGDEALQAFQRAVALKPDLPDAWRALGDHLSVIGDAAGADAAYARHIRYSTRDPRLLEPAAALCENRIAVAEKRLRKHLKQYPTDVAAIRMLAEVAARLGRYADAERLLARCLELAPGFTTARHHYAIVLHRQHKDLDALAQLEPLLAQESRNPGYRNLRAAALAGLGDYETSLQVYAEVLREYPRQARGWMSYGHALKTAGRRDESISAYRRSIALMPQLGEAYWSLANLKTFRFSSKDVATMRSQLARPDITAEDRFHLHFALGKALEDVGSYAESFEHYAEGNRLRAAALRYDPDRNTANRRRLKTFFTRQFFNERVGFGDPALDPIFIVGLPRSGSTLLEQILSSHSLVEGTKELHDIIDIAQSLGRPAARGEPSRYPDVLATLTADKCRTLGAQYLDQTRVQRRTSRPCFIDKMPNNFVHIGLIHLILPNAKIIDARRHPLGCCFSNFKQHFARGQHFTYRLEDIGRYYRDYVELMAHFDALLPGRVHRVIYERLIDDTEAEVRRLLDYCGLPFEEPCLRFYENERAVRTASSEQVRQPVYRDALDHWRHYEPWLDPLKAALGSVLDSYPDVPVFSPGATGALGLPHSPGDST